MTSGEAAHAALLNFTQPCCHLDGPGVEVRDDSVCTLIAQTRLEQASSATNYPGPYV